MTTTETRRVRIRRLVCGLCGDTIGAVTTDEWKQQHNGARCDNCNDDRKPWNVRDLMERDLVDESEYCEHSDTGDHCWHYYDRNGTEDGGAGGDYQVCCACDRREDV